MFLKNVASLNPNLIECSVKLHQDGIIPPGTWIIDLDMVARNAALLSREARRLKLTTYFMTKQINRNPFAVHTALKRGIDKAVAVDVTGAKILQRWGTPIGHVGHLSQIPLRMISAILECRPDVITVYSCEAAAAISAAAVKAGMVQKLLLKVVDEDDNFFPGQESGIWLDDLVVAAQAIQQLPGVSVAGVTAFPCLTYNNWATEDVEVTPNFRTLGRAAAVLRKEGFAIEQVNAPGNTSTATLALLAEHGATHVEPGHGLTATTPDHIYDPSRPEKPALVYVSEISHKFKHKAYAYGGGLYICLAGGPAGYPPKALVGSRFEQCLSNKLTWEKLSQENIDYYGMLVPGDRCEVGDTAIFAFRPQMFYSRAYCAAVSGIADNSPRFHGLFDAATNMLDEEHVPVAPQEVMAMVRDVISQY